MLSKEQIHSETTGNNKGKKIIQGVDFTSLYNNCLFSPIEEHFPKAAAVATFPLIITASKCMEKGSEIFKNVIDGIIKGAAIPDENDFDKMVDQFIAEEDDLIKFFPTTYYTRRKKELRRYILDEIKTGIMFWYEVAFTLKPKLKPEGCRRMLPSSSPEGRRPPLYLKGCRRGSRLEFIAAPL